MSHSMGPHITAHSALAPLLGWWQLVSCDIEFQASGCREPMYDAPAHGYIVFSPDRRMMTVIEVSRANSPSTHDEPVQIFRGVAYTGHYTVEGNEWVTRVDASSIPEWTGTTQRRSFRIESDRLHVWSGWGISARHGQRPARALLVWQRPNLELDPKEPAMDRFRDKVAIVTGATSGIGKATARALAHEGARVVIAARRSSMGEDFTAELRSQGLEAVFVRTDVRNSDSIESMVEAAVRHYGRVDIAVNNAGIRGTDRPVEDYPIDAWDELMAVNLKGVWLCMKHEIRQLLRNGGGSIVNVAADFGQVGAANGVAPYVASKHGVLGLTRAAALEYATRSIRVNAVCPAMAETQMLSEFKANEPDRYALYVDKAIPMRRTSRPEEQACAILWLCSPESSFVTGHALAVDGGALAR